MAKRKIRLLISFGGSIGGWDSPAVGQVIEVDEKLADALVREPVEAPRAEYWDDTREAIESAAVKPPEQAVKPKAKRRKG